MSSFKQKLKVLLIDSSLKVPKNIEQKFDNIMLKTFRKIKRDNTRKTILNYKNNSSKNIMPKGKIKNNFYLKENNSLNKKKGISPQTAVNMIQTLSIIKNANSRNNNYDPFYSTMYKYLDGSLKIKNKIQRNIDYIRNESSNSKNKYSICNRPKCSFIENKTVYNLKQIYSNSNKRKKLIENEKGEDILFNDNNKLKNNNLFFYESFNKLQKNKKYKNSFYSRNIFNKNISRDSYFNYN